MDSLANTGSLTWERGSAVPVMGETSVAAFAAEASTCRATMALGSPSFGVSDFFAAFALSSSL